MTPATMAALHARCFTLPPPWSAADFAATLSDRGVLCLSRPDGFALFRSVADEAELLTLAVAPEARRRGLARDLLDEGFAQAAARGATRVFLEVAAENAGARALYAGAGFAEVGRRPGYYRHPDGTRADALILARALIDDAAAHRQGPEKR